MVKSANGSASAVLGIIPFVITIYEINFKINFKAVPNLDYDMIIGMDCVRKFKININRN